jgi:hypothetical protein
MYNETAKHRQTLDTAKAHKTQKLDGRHNTNKEKCYENSEYLLILSLYEDDRRASGRRQLTRQGIVSSSPAQFILMDDNLPDLKEEHPRCTEEERMRRMSEWRCKELVHLEAVPVPAAHRANDELVHGSSFIGVVLVSFTNETIVCLHKGQDMEPGTPRIDVELLVVEHK